MELSNFERPSPDLVSLQPNMLAGKKRQLEFIKCENCRIDKQKCLPVARQWPAKCDRCREKDFPCSEGKRAKRRTRKGDFPSESSPNETLVFNESSMVLDVAVRNWTVLVTYHRNVSMAMKCIHQLSEDIIRIYPTLRDFEHSPSPAIHFHVFFEKLRSLIQKVGSELLDRLTLHGHLSLLSTVVTCSMSQHWEELKDDCGNCEDTTLPKHRHAEHEQLGNLGAQYLAKLNRLSHVFLQEDGADEELAAEVLEICDEVEKEARVVLKAFKIFDSVPLPSRDYVLFVPEYLTSHTYGKNINVSQQLDCLGRTILHHYLDSMDFYDSTMAQLCEDGYQRHENIDVADILGRTPLFIACQYGHFGTVKALLASGADCQKETCYGSRPLHHAAANGSLNVCELLLSAPGVDPNAKDGCGYSPLIIASLKGHTSVVKLMLSTPAVNIHETGGRRNWSPLGFAIAYKNKVIIRCLLDAGANAKEGLPAFFEDATMTEANNERDIIKLMVLAAREDFRVNEPDSDGRTPLYQAAMSGWVEAVIYLSGLPNINVNSKAMLGWTPLIAAAVQDAVEVVEVLVKNPEVHLETIDQFGSTAAGLATESSLYKIAELIEKEIFWRKRTHHLPSRWSKMNVP